MEATHEHILGQTFRTFLDRTNTFGSTEHQSNSEDEAWQALDEQCAWAAEVFDELKTEERLLLEEIVRDLRRVLANVHAGLLPAKHLDIYFEILLTAGLGRLFAQGESRWLTSSQCQERYDTTGERLRQAASRGTLRTKKKGKNTLYREPDVAAMWPARVTSA